MMATASASSWQRQQLSVSLPITCNNENVPPSILFSPELPDGRTYLRSMLSPTGRPQLLPQRNNTVGLTSFRSDESTIQHIHQTPLNDIICSEEFSEIEVSPASTAFHTIAPTQNSSLEGEILLGIQTSTSLSELIKLDCCLRDYPALRRAIAERKRILCVSSSSSTNPKSSLPVPNDESTASSLYMSFSLSELSTTQRLTSSPQMDLTASSCVEHSKQIGQQPATTVAAHAQNNSKRTLKSPPVISTTPHNTILPARDISEPENKQEPHHLREQLQELQTRYEASCRTHTNERESMQRVQTELHQELDTAQQRLQMAQQERRLLIRKLGSLVGQVAPVVSENTPVDGLVVVVGLVNVWAPFPIANHSRNVAIST